MVDFIENEQETDTICSHAASLENLVISGGNESTGDDDETPLHFKLRLINAVK